MNKRGQLTLFIIIAVMVVAAVIFVIFLRGGIPTKFSETEVIKVKNYISDCLNLKTKEGILAIARQGGYYKLPKESINFLDEKTAYYWKDNKPLVPAKDVVEKELSTWLEDNVENCFVLAGYEIVKGNCSVNATIGEVVSVQFNCPITVKKGIRTAKIEIFSTQLDVSIAKLLNVSNQLVDEYAKKPGYLCVTCFESIAAANNLTITVLPIMKEIFEPPHIWFLVNSTQVLNEKYLIWRFVIEQ